MTLGVSHRPVSASIERKEGNKIGIVIERFERSSAADKYEAEDFSRWSK
jgi:hypothetical protein